jgi:ferredoxin-NADP reductase
MSMLRTLADRGDERPLLLIYGSKDWDSITFREELDELKKWLNLQVEHLLTDPPPGWPGESGRVTAEVLGRLIPRDRNTRQYYVCGSRSDDGLSRGGAHSAGRFARQHRVRTLQLHLERSNPMRRRYADYLVLATAALILALPTLFALLQAR